MQTWNKEFDGFTFKSPCTIEIYCKVPNSWASFWTLHVPRIRSETGRFHSVPEVDVMENNGNRIDQWIHFGYDSVKYNRFSWGKIGIHNPDCKFHKYAVKITKEGYETYFDSKRTKKFKDKDVYEGQFIDTSDKRYLILTNASDGRFDEKFSNFMIKWIKIYKN